MNTSINSSRSVSYINVRGPKGGFFKNSSDQKDLQETMHSNECYSNADDW